MSEVEEYVKEWIKKGKPFRVPGFLCKRIIKKENCSFEEAKAILDRIVAEDRSLRYITVQAEGKLGSFRLLQMEDLSHRRLLLRITNIWSQMVCIEEGEGADHVKDDIQTLNGSPLKTRLSFPVGLYIII